LLQCLVSEVYKHADNEIDASKKSPLFSLHKKYLTKLNKKDNVSFYQWLRSFNNILFSERTFKTPAYFDSTVSDKNYLNREEKETIRSIINIPLNIQIYKNAIIFGERFSGRGIYFRESIAPRQENSYGRDKNLIKFKPHVSENQLSKFENWKPKKQYSSWCKFQCWNYKNSSNTNNKFQSPFGKSYCYGQLNFFFRIQCKSDQIIHGLPIASIISRNFKTVDKVDKIDCTEYGSMIKQNCNEIFIPITNVYASPILVAPFDVQNKPIIVTNKRIKKKTVSFCSDIMIIDHAFLFDLFPARTKNLYFDRESNYNRFEENLN
jgi:hypothetical protein